MPPCKFTFDDEKVYNGFSHGSTWNGFDNVAVTKETLDQIKQDSEIDGDYFDIEPMDNGLYSLADGFSTQIVR
jgi:hypothetical protein